MSHLFVSLVCGTCGRRRADEGDRRAFVVLLARGSKLWVVGGVSRLMSVVSDHPFERHLMIHHSVGQNKGIRGTKQVCPDATPTPCRLRSPRKIPCLAEHHYRSLLEWPGRIVTHLSLCTKQPAELNGAIARIGTQMLTSRYGTGSESTPGGGWWRYICLATIFEVKPFLMRDFICLP